MLLCAAAGPPLLINLIPAICAPTGAYEHLDKVTKRLINGILDAAKETGHGKQTPFASFRP